MACLILLAASPLGAADFSTGANWPSYGGTYSALRYSALDQINASNVQKLAPAWVFQTGDKESGLQATPIVIDGVMYLSSASNWVFALDADTGRLLWEYRFPMPADAQAAYGRQNRGVAVGNGRVFMGTADNHMVALDQKTGRELWRVNVEDARQCGCSITGAPLVVKDMVIAGVTGGDSAHRGYLTAFDARTGRLRWRFYTIPAPGEKGSETWPGDSWRFGGGSTWMTGSYDPDLDLLYWGVGNAAADLNATHRRGDNLYTCSIVALDPATGTLKWHYQEVPQDVWDYDAVFELISRGGSTAGLPPSANARSRDGPAFRRAGVPRSRGREGGRPHPRLRPLLAPAGAPHFRTGGGGPHTRRLLDSRRRRQPLHRRGARGHLALSPLVGGALATCRTRPTPRPRERVPFGLFRGCAT